MTSPTDPIHDMIAAEAKRLAPRMHEVVADALTKAAKRLAGLDRTKHPVLLPIVMRADMRVILEDIGLPEGWELGGNSRLMEQLLLINRSLGIVQRFAKERRRNYPGGIRPAGQNRSQHTFYSNDALDLGPEYADLRPAEINLLLAWDLIGAEVEDGFTLRVVHPLEPGVYGRAVPTDLSIDMLPGGEIFDNREFTGDPALGNIFDEVEIAAEEEDTGEQ
ncbi:MAG: hypothetical protein KKA97_04640 [Actinobacteria bacterium]|nr:hypothetical protein [Actinomycetota bacterium]